MTAHFLRPDGSIAHCYAAAIPLRVRHTGLAVASILDDCITHYGIRDKVHVLIRDNGSNMISAMEIVGIDSEGCFAHILQNVVAQSYVFEGNVFFRQSRMALKCSVH